ncbi:HAD-IIIC family phosphatase [Streptomyces sp. ITFR-16]|uniref:HAD-IIIC family phosphatase n=1 Tax=Streptomyces sp. ITFR-16 TaxID=3075198 RepID=UPI00288A2301|nr:HAD-IIIC family phosphatase [Streptomyces sp. ITFR-16]WNI26208.1 HAD-IIIC family phosphatase [Streptomyces sp. ITFR-16]
MTETTADLREITAEDYPAVRGLVAGLEGDALLRAGRVLARLDPGKVLAAHPGTPAPLIAVTGHGTLSALVPALTGELARHGLLARVRLSDFDSWVFDLADPGSALYAAAPSLVLCVLDPELVADELPLPWRVEDVERVLAEKTALVERAAEVFAATAPGATLVLNTLPLPRSLTAQLVDLGSRARLGVLWREANARLLRLVETRPEVVTVDLDPLLAEGVAARDARQSVYAKAHLSDALLAGYAREVGHLARQSAGGAKKVLALDLDDTVWGGVLGEAGPEGIEVAGSYRGEAFRRFQAVAKQLGSQGVLLAAVSKNDQEPVLKTLREHPELTLREDDFVQVRANWRPKHENLAELAAGLNLGTDSFVFVDDSSFECGLVRRELPGVAVLQVDREPAHHAERLLRDGWFDVRALTSEDRARPARYREERARQDFLHTFESLDGYLRELDISVTLAPVDAARIDRISQLTLRTNQFNLTTRRLRPAEVRALHEDPAAHVLAIESADRFGDNGLVGAVLLRRDAQVVHIENFLLSCRVFSRGIEQAVLGAVLEHAFDAGAAEVRAAYVRTARNGKVADFYPRAGFGTVREDAASADFRLASRPAAAAVDHIRLTARFEGTSREDRR